MDRTTGNGILIATVGIPRSGKTTWARQLALEKGYPVVSPDDVRLALTGERYVQEREVQVWSITRDWIRRLFRRGHSHVILDATNRNVRARSWTAPGPRDPWTGVQYKTFPTSTEECIRRAEREGRQDLLPVIEHMAATLEWLRPEETAYTNGGKEA